MRETPVSIGTEKRGGSIQGRLALRLVQRTGATSHAYHETRQRLRPTLSSAPNGRLFDNRRAISAEPTAVRSVLPVIIGSFAFRNTGDTIACFPKSNHRIRSCRKPRKTRPAISGFHRFLVLSLPHAFLARERTEAACSEFVTTGSFFGGFCPCTYISGCATFAERTIWLRQRSTNTR